MVSLNTTDFQGIHLSHFRQIQPHTVHFFYGNIVGI